jgi:hypothetical protein
MGIELKGAIDFFERIHDVIGAAGHVETVAARIPRKSVVRDRQVDLLRLYWHRTGHVVHENPLGVRSRLAGGKPSRGIENRVDDRRPVLAEEAVIEATSENQQRGTIRAQCGRDRVGCVGIVVTAQISMQRVDSGSGSRERRDELAVATRKRSVSRPCSPRLAIVPIESKMAARPSV